MTTTPAAPAPATLVSLVHPAPATPVSLVHPDRFTGPCGCTGCEKWADCDYCGSCSPAPHGEEQAIIDAAENRADFYYEAEAAYYDEVDFY